MSINTLFIINEITATGGDKIVASVSFNPLHPVFKGHFPGNPITPGVIIARIARAIVEQHRGRRFQLSAAPSIKYSAVLSPVEHPSATYALTCKEIDGVVKVSCVISDTAVTFSRMTLVLIPA